MRNAPDEDEDADVPKIYNYLKHGVQEDDDDHDNDGSAGHANGDVTQQAIVMMATIVMAMLM